MGVQRNFCTVAQVRLLDIIMIEIFSPAHQVRIDIALRLPDRIIALLIADGKRIGIDDFHVNFGGIVAVVAIFGVQGALKLDDFAAQVHPQDFIALVRAEAGVILRDFAQVGALRRKHIEVESSGWLNFGPKNEAPVFDAPFCDHPILVSNRVWHHIAPFLKKTESVRLLSRQR